MSQNHTTSIATIDFAEEVGTVVFQSALMHYLQSVQSSDAESFEEFVDAHVESESFMEDLCKEYPDFAVALKNEIADFKADADTLSL